MRIAVYSGSFDPLHIGHKAVMEHLTGRDGFDMVYLVVSPQNPFKGKEKLLTARRRFRAAMEAVERHPLLKVKVDDIEMKMPPPQYTIKTLDALKAREPENDFTLVIGADNLDCIMDWRDPVRLLTEYGVVVFPREGYDAQALREALLETDPRFRIEIADAPLVNVSSTMIREASAKGKDMSSFLM